MTIKEKAEKEGLEVEAIVAIAAEVGIDTSDVNAILSSADAMKLGKAVKSAATGDAPQKTIEENEVRFWSANVKHIVVVGREKIKFDGHVLVLRKDTDGDLIKKIRKLKVNDIFEVINQPFHEDSNEYIQFSDMLEDLVFTGNNGEKSKAGIKAVRVMFGGAELSKLGEAAFVPKKLVMKALHSKSCIRVVNLK